jgi:hypothetical protein
MEGRAGYSGHVPAANQDLSFLSFIIIRFSLILALSLSFYLFVFPPVLQKRLTGPHWSFAPTKPKLATCKSSFIATEDRNPSFFAENF